MARTVPIEVKVADLPQIVEALKILCDLATVGAPLHEMGCAICDIPGYAHGLLRPEQHYEDCPWRRAVEWVAANGGDGGG